tara:strand:- start:7788 stop:8645 length:858 start_codon:yes stop_codon:yes gene_type:complete
MKNIIWIASYPKSGNTMLRLFLASYLFTENGIFNNLDIIRNITTFNNFDIYKNIKGICKKDDFITNPEIISKYWIPAQKMLYENFQKKIFILKTHNANIFYKGDNFTNENYTRCFLYIVRDPRSVLVSTKYHYNYKNYETAASHLISDKHITYAKNNLLPEFLLSWKSNYLSWKNFSNSNALGLIIKYENLINKPEEGFLEIIKFLENKHSIEFDKKKFKNAIKSIKFQNLQNMEAKYGFEEKSKYASQFFRKGIIDEWKNEVPESIILKIEKAFEKEMTDLGYL